MLSDLSSWKWSEYDQANETYGASGLKRTFHSIYCTQLLDFTFAPFIWTHNLVQYFHSGSLNVFFLPMATHFSLLIHVAWIYLCQVKVLKCQSVRVFSAQPCLTLCNPVDSSPSGSAVHGILQARILDCVAISYFRGTSRPRNKTRVTCISRIGRRTLYPCTTWEAILFNVMHYYWSSLVAQRVRRLPVMQETWVRSLGQEDPLEKEMATHSSTLAWKILWTEKPGRLQSMGSQRVRHDWATSQCRRRRLLILVFIWIISN